MFSHTVPKKLLEQFAYYDLRTKSRRLWQYQKGLPPWWKASPGRATAWDGHFADPANAAKEEQLELRLKQEFEDPVNEFIEKIGYSTFFLSPTCIRLLTGYMRMLFTRSRARQAASKGQTETMIEALRSLRSNEQRISELIGKYTMEVLERGLGTRMVTREEVIQSIDNSIEKHSAEDEPQRRYIHALETMMEFPDENVLNGDWLIVRTDPDKPFLIGDAPVVTWERTDNNLIYFGQGFARPNVEACLPVSPTACLYVLPRVARTRPVFAPTSREVNMAQAAFATQHCFGNINSPEIDAVLQQDFGKVRLGITGFNTHHIDYNQVLFDTLMGRRPRAA
jgi:hypothetical protein